MNATRKTATAKPTVQEKEPDLVSWLILITLSIIWGSSYILIKKSLVVYSSTEVACLRLADSSI